MGETRPQGNRTYRTIKPVEAAALLLRAPGMVVVDIRDAESFARGHITGAQHAGSSDLPGWLMQTPRTTPLLVCCYHGISSQDYARLLAVLGFREVYSLDGGFEAWNKNRSVTDP